MASPKAIILPSSSNKIASLLLNTTRATKPRIAKRIQSRGDVVEYSYLTEVHSISANMDRLSQDEYYYVNEALESFLTAS